MKCSLAISNFLEEMFSLSNSIVSLYLNCSHKKTFLSLLAIFWNSAFRWVYHSLSALPFASLLSYLSGLLNFVFLHFFSLGMDGLGHHLLYSVMNCITVLSIVLQAFCLIDLIP